MSNNIFTRLLIRQEKKYFIEKGVICDNTSSNNGWKIRQPLCFLIFVIQQQLPTNHLVVLKQFFTNYNTENERSQNADVTGSVNANL